LALVARNWSSYFGLYTKAKVTGYYYSSWEVRPDSTFMKQLLNLQIPVGASKWQELKKAYIDNSDIRACFGNDLEFLEADVESRLQLQIK
jgi:hypothetical protein